MTTNNKTETVTPPLAERERWSTPRKFKVVLRLLQGESMAPLPLVVRRNLPPGAVAGESADRNR